MSTQQIKFNSLIDSLIEKLTKNKGFTVYLEDYYGNINLLDNTEGFVSSIESNSLIYDYSLNTKFIRDFIESKVTQFIYYFYSDDNNDYCLGGWVSNNELYIEISKGKADIKIVLKDILALTKLNYNACIYGDGIPVTLRFANAIGEILTASPIKESPPLAFKFYI